MGSKRTHKASCSGGTPANELAFTGRCFFQGFLLGTDGTNDPTITVYDNIASSGREIVPTTTYDASALGLNGAMIAVELECNYGIFVDITCAGACEVVVIYG